MDNCIWAFQKAYAQKRAKYGKNFRHVVWAEDKNDFESDIIGSIQTFDVVKSIEPRNSELEPGLQFVDNICSAIRLHESNTDEDGFYGIIEKRSKKYDSITEFMVSFQRKGMTSRPLEAGCAGKRRTIPFFIK